MRQRRRGQPHPAIKKTIGAVGKAVGAGLRGYLKATDAVAKKIEPYANKLPHARPIRRRGVK